MEQVLVLTQREPVRVDPDRLNELYSQLGAAGAEDVVCRAMEELAVRLSHVERLYRQQKLDDMRKGARALVAISEQVGMHAVARAARHVTDCVDSGDRVALAATLARLLRVGEQSLMAIWEMQDVHI